ncbi:unnamed protein product [Brassica napus]|uniref:(rape) hypothetical protein n=1 Tax=Brassica napus TaxID=3708 RepID=A0A816SV90_BRANA|nr:unnamed protein product [Brassica napus]
MKPKLRSSVGGLSWLPPATRHIRTAETSMLHQRGCRSKGNTGMKHGRNRGPQWYTSLPQFTQTERRSSTKPWSKSIEEADWSKTGTGTAATRPLLRRVSDLRSDPDRAQSANQRRL